MTIGVSVVERVRSIVEPVLAARAVELYDVEHTGASLRILVETQDLTVIEGLTRAISHALDEADPIPDRYTLEVSSPGLERPLRTPNHFQGAVGTTVTLKTHPGVDGERRVVGVLESADDNGVTVAGRHVAYDEIERARTVFEWGPAPKPGSARKQTKERTA